MTLFNLIAATDTDQDVRIYDATGAKEESEIKCIYSGLSENIELVLTMYKVVRITLDNECLSVTVVRR